MSEDLQRGLEIAKLGRRIAGQRRHIGKLREELAETKAELLALHGLIGQHLRAAPTITGPTYFMRASHQFGVRYREFFPAPVDGKEASNE